jgi:hypothetical protein
MLMAELRSWILFIRSTFSEAKGTTIEQMVGREGRGHVSQVDSSGDA